MTDQTAKRRENKVLRRNEYYAIQDVFDGLYAKSKQGAVFTDLMSLIASPQNIALAYRRIKRNKGSRTPGTNMGTIQDISNYFRKFSMEYKAVHQVENFDNDWYEYVEYGTTNPITIFLQQNGFSREASIYIQTPSNYSKYVTDVDGEKKIKRSILECGNIGVETEAQDIQFNIPELFVE